LKFLVLLALLTSCMYGQWITGYYSANNGVEPVSAIPWSKYTHLIHFAASAGVGTNGQGNGTVNMQYLVQPEINQLITSRPAGKKVIVELADNGSYLMAFAQNTAPGMINTFVNNIVSFVISNGYDGVDIDWEANINTAQYQNLITLLRTAMPSKIITVAAGDWGGMPTAIAGISQDLDQVNVMCYDMDNDRTPSWYNDALLQAGDYSERACDARVSHVTAAGTPAAKIGVGIPFYGRRNIGVTQPGVAGNFPQFTVFYRNLVSDPARWQGAFMQYDTVHKADYLSVTTLNEFVSYNGTRSIGDIVSWAKAQGFGGFMTFTVEYEYLAGQTGDARYPLSTVLYSDVFGASQLAPDPGPILSAGSPSGTLNASTSATLSLTTNVNATCAYATTAGIDYPAMPNTFITTGGTAHSTTVTNLQPGNSYSYYVKCADQAGVNNPTDYVISFAIAAAGPAAQVTPAVGFGMSASFLLQVSDARGYAALQQASLMISNGSVAHACYIDYWAPSRTLYLWNDAGTGATSAVLGSATVLSNSQCSVDALAATVTGADTTLTLYLPVSFTWSYTGGKTLFTFAADSALASGWKQSGSWIVE